jgi:hypothetical protein
VLALRKKPDGVVNGKGSAVGVTALGRVLGTDPGSTDGLLSLEIWIVKYHRFDFVMPSTTTASTTDQIMFALYAIKEILA